MKGDFNMKKEYIKPELEILVVDNGIFLNQSSTTMGNILESDTLVGWNDL